jgi:hypothetical protein
LLALLAVGGLSLEEKHQPLWFRIAFFCVFVGLAMLWVVLAAIAGILGFQAIFLRCRHCGKFFSGRLFAKTCRACGREE